MDDLSTLPILESTRVDDERKSWTGAAPRRSQRTPRPRQREPEADEENVCEDNGDAEHVVDVSV
jgi:hypothetical protein